MHIQCCIWKGSPIIYSLSKTNPPYIKSYFFKIYSNIFPSSMSRLFRDRLSESIPHSGYMSRPPLNFLDSITLTILCGWCKLASSQLRSRIRSSFPSLLDPQIRLVSFSQKPLACTAEEVNSYRFISFNFDSSVTRFKACCFELVQQDVVLVWSPARKNFQPFMRSVTTQNAVEFE